MSLTKTYDQIDFFTEKDSERLEVLADWFDKVYPGMFTEHGEIVPNTGDEVQVDIRDISERIKKAIEQAKERTMGAMTTFRAFEKIKALSDKSFFIESALDEKPVFIV